MTTKPATGGITKRVGDLPIVKELTAKLEKAIEGLNFYAEISNWQNQGFCNPEMDNDMGDKARNLLAELEE